MAIQYVAMQAPRSHLPCWFGLCIATACGGSAAPPQPASSKPAHQSHGAEAHGPLVHRFEDADRWVTEFDDPDRDAWQRPDNVIAAMEMKPGMVVADVGAGTGYFESRLSSAVGDHGRVLALDVEQDMIRHLTERAEREQLSNVQAVLVAGEDPGLAAASVDRILIVDTWHHIPDRVAYGQKLRAALKPGGKVFIVDFKLEAKRGPPARHRIAPEQVVEELKAAGLAADIILDPLPEQYIVVAAQPD